MVFQGLIAVYKIIIFHMFQQGQITTTNIDFRKPHAEQVLRDKQMCIMANNLVLPSPQPRIQTFQLIVGHWCFSPPGLPMAVLEQYGLCRSAVPALDQDLLVKYQAVIWFSTISHIIGIGIVVLLYYRKGSWPCCDKQQAKEGKPKGKAKGGWPNGRWRGILNLGSGIRMRLRRGLSVSR